MICFMWYWLLLISVFVAVGILIAHLAITRAIKSLVQQRDQLQQQVTWLREALEWIANASLSDFGSSDFAQAYTAFQQKAQTAIQQASDEHGVDNA